jgi:hypothetical protein
MSEQLPPKDVPPESAADPNQLSNEDLKKVAGGIVPIPMPRPPAAGSGALQRDERGLEHVHQPRCPVRQAHQFDGRKGAAEPFPERLAEQSHRGMVGGCHLMPQHLLQ